jgi:hypothetical protein
MSLKDNNAADAASEGANAPITANAENKPANAEEKNKWTPKNNESKEIFGSDIHSDKRVMELLKEEFGKIEYGKIKTVDDICQETWVTACNVNTKKIVEYCTEVLMK